ncbi:hypothetical protein [Streptomyces sp. GESEQ-35]|uniref:hypothetical protein n=1 Tax=Streptomyces sp. GESEQ-35 TaxID=2812657 RepID=UPI001B340B5F|nr:hypothetical protein [Streptomyces sp. GESEQ-35]
MVPESRAGIETMSALPALQAPVKDTELVARCAEITETLLLDPVPSVSSAAYFQFVEPRFGSEELLGAAVPLVRPETLRLTLSELDPDRLSAPMRDALAEFLQ